MNGKVCFRNDTYDRDHKKQPYAKANCQNQHCGVYHRTYLISKNGKVRFRHGYKHTHEKADESQKAETSRLCDAFSDVPAYRGHCYISTEIKKTDTEHKENGADEKNRPLQPCERCHRCE